MTLISQTHGWRGFSADRDLMDCMFVCGFVTIYISRRPILDKLVQMLSLEKRLKATRENS